MASYPPVVVRSGVVVVAVSVVSVVGAVVVTSGWVAVVAGAVVGVCVELRTVVGGGGGLAGAVDWALVVVGRAVDAAVVVMASLPVAGRVAGPRVVPVTGARDSSGVTSRATADRVAGTDSLRSRRRPLSFLAPPASRGQQRPQLIARA